MELGIRKSIAPLLHYFIHPVRWSQTSNSNTNQNNFLHICPTMCIKRQVLFKPNMNINPNELRQYILEARGRHSSHEKAYFSH